MIVEAAYAPSLIEPDGGGEIEMLLDAAVRNRPSYSRELRRGGALLFRGWRVETSGQFRRFVAALAGIDMLFDYAGGASPRSGLGEEGVYSSTDYPPELALSLHNELSYAALYPSRLYFFCLKPAEQGGETTLGDSRRILRRIDPAIRDRFRRKQIRYVRNLSPDPGSGYSWQEAFATSEPAAAEARCRAIGADYEWGDDGFLRISQVRPATAFHPDTGEEVWFNQADGFHPSALHPETYQAQLQWAGSEDRFRLGVTYADHSPIERAALDHIRAVIRDEAVPHCWRTGDVLVLDNLLSAHGRRPFSGPRKIALAMT